MEDISVGAAFVEDSKTLIYPRAIRGFAKEYYWLSNFYDASVTIDGIEYGSSEAAYQAGRCITEEGKLEFAVLDAASARKHAHHDIVTRSDWQDFRIAHMKRVVREKFRQNAGLAMSLSQLDGMLEETNDWHDNFWGNCTCPACRETPGQNMLGRILMEIRSEGEPAIAQAGRHQQHRMRLCSDPYDKVASGSKTIELRLYDEKRKGVRVGDTIVFERFEDAGGSIPAIVIGVDVYPDFRAMFRDIDLVAAGYAPEDLQDADAADMNRFYSPEEQANCCAVAITFEVVKDGQSR